MHRFVLLLINKVDNPTYRVRFFDLAYTLKITFLNHWKIIVLETWMNKANVVADPLF